MKISIKLLSLILVLWSFNVASADTVEDRLRAALIAADAGEFHRLLSENVLDLKKEYFVRAHEVGNGSTQVFGNTVLALVLSAAIRSENPEPYLSIAESLVDLEPEVVNGQSSGYFFGTLTDGRTGQFFRYSLMDMAVALCSVPVTKFLIDHKVTNVPQANSGQPGNPLDIYDTGAMELRRMRPECNEVDQLTYSYSQKELPAILKQKSEARAAICATDPQIVADAAAYASAQAAKIQIMIDTMAKKLKEENCLELVGSPD